jgi:hypothetical protein
MDKEKLAGFLEDISIASMKHGIYIEGCGCCDSPYLCEMDDKTKHGDYKYTELIGDHLTWVPVEK